jgi:hypothetical protein
LFVGKRNSVVAMPGERKEEEEDERGRKERERSRRGDEGKREK